MGAEVPLLSDSRNFLHMASTLARALDVREVVDLVADHVTPVYGVHAMALLVAERGRMHIVGSHGYPRETLDRFDGLPLTSPTPAEQVMRTATRLLQLTRRTPARLPGPRAFQRRGRLGVPAAHGVRAADRHLHVRLHPPPSVHT